MSSSRKNVNSFVDAVGGYCRDTASSHTQQASQHKQNFRDSGYTDRSENKQYHRHTQKASDLTRTARNLDQVRR